MFFYIYYFILGCEVNLIGSLAYGLAMEYSDLDGVITLPSHTDTSYANALLVVEEAKDLLQQQSVFENFFTWVNLTIPVLSFDHAPTQIGIDVSFNNQDEPRRSQLVGYMLRLDKRARNLAFLVKYWLNVMGQINLRNHGCLLLVIFYLQQKHVLPSVESLQRNATPYMIDEWDYSFDKLKYHSQNTDSLRSIIGGFFTFYSEFDFENYIVSAYAGYPIPKHAFNSTETAPPEFELYKKNVNSMISEPLPVTDGVMIQDAFVHNELIANYLLVPMIRAAFKDADKKFQRNPTTFLKHLRKLKSLAIHKIVTL